MPLWRREQLRNRRSYASLTRRPVPREPPNRGIERDTELERSSGPRSESSPSVPRLRPSSARSKGSTCRNDSVRKRVLLGKTAHEPDGGTVNAILVSRLEEDWQTVRVPVGRAPSATDTRSVVRACQQRCEINDTILYHQLSRRSPFRTRSRCENRSCGSPLRRTRPLSAPVATRSGRLSIPSSAEPERYVTGPYCRFLRNDNHGRISGR